MTIAFYTAPDPKKNEEIKKCSNPKGLKENNYFPLF
jgi:hypothetical protein